MPESSTLIGSAVEDGQTPESTYGSGDITDVGYIPESSTLIGSVVGDVSVVDEVAGVAVGVASGVDEAIGEAVGVASGDVAVTGEAAGASRTRKVSGDELDPCRATPRAVAPTATAIAIALSLLLVSFVFGSFGMFCSMGVLYYTYASLSIRLCVS